LSINYHPITGSIVTVNFDKGFKKPEMVKNRLCVVISPDLSKRGKLCTVIPLSKTKPNFIKKYHYKFTIPFQLPKGWGTEERWAKCDMINAVGFHRVSLLKLGKNDHGQRVYQKNTLSEVHLTEIKKSVLHGMGMSNLTVHL
jgi:mRNA interferase MazF